MRPPQITDPQQLKMIREAFPRMVAVLGKTANNPKAKTSTRLEAIELLLRVIDHPFNADGHLSANVKAALKRAIPFLISITGSKQRGRTRLRTARALLTLASLGY
jgi:hypothetical protein